MACFRSKHYKKRQLKGFKINGLKEQDWGRGKKSIFSLKILTFRGIGKNKVDLLTTKILIKDSLLWEGFFLTVFWLMVIFQAAFIHTYTNTHIHTYTHTHTTHTHLLLTSSTTVQILWWRGLCLIHLCALSLKHST